MPKSTYFDVACVVLFLLLNWKPTTTGGLCSPCPGSWTVFGRFCYIFVDQPLTYDDAEAHCYSLSRTFRKSHLISIADEDENDFVAGYAESAGGTTLGQIWLGMEDRSIENDWQWADGSESTYRNWASGEPNNKSGDQDCAQFLLNPGWSYVTFSSWDDINCGNKYVFMCKMPSR